jgi:hypothetical protein
MRTNGDDYWYEFALALWDILMLAAGVLAFFIWVMTLAGMG